MDSRLLWGTVDMLVLDVISRGPNYGYQITQLVTAQSKGRFDLKEGSLYPALHRLERKGLLASKWETAKDRNREFKYYRLTPKGRKQLAAEESKWKQMARAIGQVMWPAEEG